MVCEAPPTMGSDRVKGVDVEVMERGLTWGWPMVVRALWRQGCHYSWLVTWRWGR